MMKMRTTKPEQLNLVFADSPQGGQAAEVPDLLGTAKARLHKAKGKEFSGFVAGSHRSPSDSSRCLLIEESSKEPDA